MICFCIFGLQFAVDFTAPALLALLSIVLPRRALLRTVLAALLHECAHLLAIAAAGESPQRMRVSAAGLRLEMRGTAICPVRRMAVILAAGPAANLLAALCFQHSGMPESAAANLSLALFNLLPYPATDGGSLLCCALEQRFADSRPDLPPRILTAASWLTTAALAAFLLRAGIRNLSLWGMLLFMLFSR